MATHTIINHYSVALSICIALNIIVCLWILISQSSLPPQVPLFYGLPLGEEQLVPAQFLLIPPFIATILSGVNFLIIRVIKDDFLKIILLSGIVLMTILSAITISKIIWIL